MFRFKDNLLAQFSVVTFVVVLTALAQEFDKQKAKEVGADFFSPSLSVLQRCL